MAEKKKETFKISVTDESTNETKTTEYAVVTPSPQQGRQAQMVYTKTFAEVLANDGLLRKRIMGYMREQGLWDDAKQAEQDALVDKLSELELKLQKGGIKLTDAKGLAIDMRRARLELRELIAERNELDANSVEGQAENARFNALVSMCLVYNESGEPVYSSLDDYLANSTDEQAFRGAQTLASMMFSVDKDAEANLPENKFLKRWKFCDDELRLVNKDKQLVDTEGRLIDKDGRYIDEHGNFVDKDGNPVDEEGNYVVQDAAPFLDDDGNPLDIPADEEQDDQQAAG